MFDKIKEKEKGFDKEIEKMINGLNKFHDNSSKTISFVVICGYKSKVKEGEIQFKVAGAGDLAQLATMMYVASKNDKRYAMIFETVMKIHEGEQSKEPVQLKLRPTISRSFGKGE